MTIVNVETKLHIERGKALAPGPGPTPSAPGQAIPLHPSGQHMIWRCPSVNCSNNDGGDRRHLCLRCLPQLCELGGLRLFYVDVRVFTFSSGRAQGLSRQPRVQEECT